MAIVVPKKFHIKLPRLLVFMICKYLMKSLNINSYVIAGSYRRKKKLCNDIDIVLPIENMVDIDAKMKSKGWRLNPFRNHEATFSRQYIKLIKFFNIRKTIVIDIMPYGPDNLGNVLVFATGSKNHNDIIRKRLRDRNMSWSDPGCFLNTKTGEKICFNSEKEVFLYLDMPNTSPENRDGTFN